MNYISVYLNGKQVNALVDTGASNVVVSKSFVERHGLQNNIVYRKKLISTAEKSSV